MPTFTYKARSRNGEKAQGTLEANDRRAALGQLERMGYVPISVQEASVAAGKEKTRASRFQWRRGVARMSHSEVLTFTTELSDLLSSGMTLGNALNALARRRTGSPSDEIIISLRDQIVQGASLSDALAQHPDTFGNLYVSMIRAGEASGAMADVLSRLTAHFERLQEIKEKVVMALVYPLIVMLMGGATMIFSMVYVVPKFEQVFAQLGEALPLPTQILISSSRALAQYGWLMAIVVFVLGSLIMRAVKTENGQRWWHGMQLKLPLIKGVIASATFANFSRTLETLLVNGVPALQALGIVEQTLSNSVIAREVHHARERVTDGTTISRPLAAGKVFPQMMTDMLAIGEETGDMAGALGHIGRRYENELNRNLKVFTTALEPILIVVVAVGVGFVAISILMAVFSLTNGLDV